MTYDGHTCRSTRIGAWIALAVVTALAAGCGAGNAGTTSATAASEGSGPSSVNVIEPARGAPAPGGLLVFAISADSDGWDPTSNRWSNSGETVGNALFDPLAAWDQSYQARPYLAQAFEHDDTYRTWTIRLRPGVTFHDGEPLDAAAVKKDLDAVRQSPLTGAALRPVESIEVLDAATVVVHMVDVSGGNGWVAFPASLTGQAGMIAAPKMLDDHENGSRDPVGSGPFAFDKWTPDADISLERYAGYWRKDADGRPLPYLDGVDFKPIPETQSAHDALRTGDVNLVATSSQVLLNRLRADAAAGEIQYLQSAGELEERSVMLNTSKPPLDDVRVRKALAMATDQQHIAELTGADPALIATGPFVPGTHWAVGAGYPAFDLGAAKALMAEVVAEHGPVRFTLQCSDNTENQQLCQALAAGWGEAGADVTIASVDQVKLIANALVGDYDATIWRQFGSPDPDGDSMWWNGANASGGLTLDMARNQDPVLDAALAVGRTNPIDEQRKLAYVTVQQQLAKDLPYLWLSHIPWGLGAQKLVRGIDTATFPDGSTGAAFSRGVERVTEVWLER